MAHESRSEGIGRSMKMESVQLRNYGGFDEAKLCLEPDLTMLFGENGSGKSTLLEAIWNGLRDMKRGARTKLSHARASDPRDRCEVVWKATTRDGQSIEWGAAAYPGGADEATWGQRRAIGEMHQTRLVVARYAEQRFGQGSKEEQAVLRWLKGGTMEATAALRESARVTPGVGTAWVEDGEVKVTVERTTDDWGSPRTKEGRWESLSNGQRMVMGLTVDVARRMHANGWQGGGIVLIDDIASGLHPRTEREVVKTLRERFEDVQIVATTHSPQVLSACENRQARWCRKNGIEESPASIHVHGRDSNSILREHMDTTERDAEGERMLRELYRLIDRGETERAREETERMRGRWGTLDPALIRAQGFIDER